MQERLEAVLAEHKVPGAVLGILQDGKVTAYATGIANANTGVEVTDDTLFQIGSISKVWTATLIMQLVDDGVLDLDEPVVTYLPELKIADATVNATVTLRDLLSHRSGIGGDHILETGRGDDTLERYVETCAELGQEHELGATMSYCNTGYSIAGRVIEKVTGKLWDAVLRERIIEPLALTHTNTLPEEAILWRVAVGHPEEGKATKMWVLPRSAGPAGLINSTAADLLTFAQLHLDEGRAQDGTQLLSVSSVKQMQEAQITVPDKWTLGDRWGVGWILFEWEGHPVYGHDGSTIGQRAYLRVVPEAGLAVCLLTNGGESGDAFKKLCGEIVRQHAGITMPVVPSLPDTAPDVDLSKYEGTYSRLNVEMTLTRDGDALLGKIKQSGPLAEMLHDEEDDDVLTIRPVDSTLFLATSKDLPSATPVVFFDFDGDTPARFHFGARAMTRKATK